MEILIMLFLGWSLTNILVNGSILDKIRDYSLVKIRPLGKLLSCVMCSGFWVGLFIYLVAYYFSNFVNIDLDVFIKDSMLNSIPFAFINSGFSVIVNSIIIYLIKE